MKTPVNGQSQGGTDQLLSFPKACRAHYAPGPSPPNRETIRAPRGIPSVGRVRASLAGCGDGHRSVFRDLKGAGSGLTCTASKFRISDSPACRKWPGVLALARSESQDSRRSQSGPGAVAGRL